MLLALVQRMLGGRKKRGGYKRGCLLSLCGGRAGCFAGRGMGKYG